MTSLENRMLLVENNIEHINQSITEIRNDIRGINSRVDSLEARMDSNLKWLLSVILATWITTIGAVIGSAVAL